MSRSLPPPALLMLMPLPVEPPASRWLFPDPRATGDQDVVTVGADLEPGTILSAYRQGMFPMRLRDGALAWWSPVERAVLPLEGLKISRSLRRSARRLRTTTDLACAEVIAGCAHGREDNWISTDFYDAYLDLHQRGWVHSVESWDDTGALVGGLYGVALGGLFCGESMFHRVTDASKVALMHLVELMKRHEGGLLDVQWTTPHLNSMGATVIGRDRYMQLLPRALAAESPWPSGPS
jgi:leucyl/phenylalanyl-tRNA---protein transferase